MYRWLLMIALASAVSCGGGEVIGGMSADAGIGVGPDATASSQDASMGMQADAGQLGAALGTFEMTYYWLAFEDEYPGGAQETIYDQSCQVLANITVDFGNALRLEGSGKLVDGRVLNYEGSCACANSPCFFEVAATAPWGQGSMGQALEPFRSIAVDSSDIPVGSGIYIQELDGLTMPGDAAIGMYVHDGCVFADDIGGAITGQHIDFFAGLREHYLTIIGLVGGDFVELRAGGNRCPGR